MNRETIDMMGIYELTYRLTNMQHRMINKTEDDKRNFLAIDTIIKLLKSENYGDHISRDLIIGRIQDWYKDIWNRGELAEPADVKILIDDINKMSLFNNGIAKRSDTEMDSKQMESNELKGNKNIELKVNKNIDEIYNIASEICKLTKINETLQEQLSMNKEKIDKLNESLAKFKPVIYLKDEE